MDRIVLDSYPIYHRKYKDINNFLMLMRKQLLASIQDCIKAAEQLKLPYVVEFIEKVSQAIADAFQAGNQVIIAGNGGSLCDAAHFAEELTGFFRQYRRPLP